jgi:hypothetical protein
LFEALTIIDEIREDVDLMNVVGRCDRRTIASFEVAANFLDSEDYNLMAKMRNVIAFHYNAKLPLRRLKKLVEKFPGHVTSYSLGSETLDWYFDLGDLIADEIVVREVFGIPDDADIKEVTLKVLNRQHDMATAFTDFAGFFIRSCVKQG